MLNMKFSNMKFRPALHKPSAYLQQVLSRLFGFYQMYYGHTELLQGQSASKSGQA